MPELSDDDLLKAFDGPDDEQLLSAFDKQVAPTAVQQFKQGVNPISGSELGRGVTRGIPQIAEGLAGTTEAVAQLVGATNVKRWAKEAGDSASAVAKSIPRSIKDVRDIETMGDLGDYAMAAIGEVVPQMVSMIVPMAVAGRAGQAAGLGTKGMKAALGTAAFVPAAAQEAGHNYRGIRDETGKEAPGIALATGAASGLLETFTPARLLGKFFSQSGGQAKKLAWRTLMNRTAVEAARSGGIEGMTEMGQESISLLANKLADDTYELINGENAWRVLNAGVSGLFAGMVMGGASPTVDTIANKASRASRYAKAKEVRAGQEVRRNDLTTMYNNLLSSVQTVAKPVMDNPEALAVTDKIMDRSTGIPVNPTPKPPSQPEPVAPTVQVSQALPVTPVAKEVTGDVSTTPVVDTPAKPVPVNFQGLAIQITNPVGSVRSGQDADGKKWSVTMPASYGDIRRTEGKDGDPVDVYVGPNPQSAQVFVVDQQKKEGVFDEQKVMLGFDTAEQAVAAYDAAFSDGSGPSRRQAVTPTTMDQFKVWLDDGDTKKPFATKAGPVEPAALPPVQPATFSPVVQRAIDQIQPQLDLMGVQVVQGDAGTVSGISALVFGQPDQRQITIDPQVVQSQLDQLTPKLQKKYLSKALREEVVHVATHDAIAALYAKSDKSIPFNQFARDYLNDIYAEMGPLVLDSARAYLQDETIATVEQALAGYSGTHMVAAEFIRQITDVQSGITEFSTVSAWGKRFPKLAAFLNQFIQSLKALSARLKKGDVLPRITQAVTQVEQVLAKSQPRKTKASRYAKTKVAPPVVAQGSRAVRMFDRETELVGHDILDWIKDFGGMLSKTNALATKGKDWFKANASLWDGSGRLVAPHHNLIFVGSSTPDQIAQAAADARMLRDPDVNELWEAINKASGTRVRAVVDMKREGELADRDARELQAWQTATADGEVRVTGGQLKVGDVMDVEGERVDVTDVDPETGDVLLSDGTRFGIQRLAEGQEIYVERLDKAVTDEGFDPFALDAIESVEDQRDRLADEQLKKDAAARRTELERLANKRLVGTQGDIGQVDMLDPDRNDLLSMNPLLAKQQTDLQAIQAKGVIQTSNATIVAPGPTGEVLGAVRAHHGTPHKVDRFSLDKIGTGEGAQAYGWGLYFAQNKDVAEQYRKTLSANQSPSIEVLRKYFTPGNIVPSWGGKQDRVISFNPDKAGGWSVTVESVEQSGDRWVANGRPRTHMTAPTTKVLESAGITEASGNTYHVELDVEEDQLLDWDKPLSQQSDYVKERIARLIPLVSEEIAKKFGWGDISDPTAGKVDQAPASAFYTSLGYSLKTQPEHTVENDSAPQGWGTFQNSAFRGDQEVGNEQRASNQLRQLGIRGIRYLDEGSRHVRSPEVIEKELMVVREDLEALRSGTSGFVPETNKAFIASLPNKIAALEKELAETKQTRNYVIFDDKLIKIIGQNGEIIRPTEMIGEQVGSVASTPDVARRALETAGTRSVEAQQIEASNIAGQLGFLERKLTQYAPVDGDANVIRAALSVLGYYDVTGANVMATSIVAPAEYAEALQRMPLDYRETYAKEVAMRFKVTKTKLQQVIEDQAKAAERIAGPVVARLIDRTQTAAIQADYLTQAQQVFEADVADSIVSFKKLLETSAHNEGQAEQFLTQLRAAETQQTFSEALKLAVKDIVEVIATSEQALPLLYAAGKATDISDTYIRLKNELLAEGKTMPMQDRMIIRWASELLEHSNELANRMVSLAVLQRNAEVRAAYSDTHLKLADQLRKNPRKAGLKLLREARKFGTKTEKANAAFAALNSQLMTELRDLEVLDTAASVANQFMADPEVVAYERQVNGDVVQARPDNAPDPDNLQLQNGILLPDGTTTTPIVLYGDEARFKQSQQTMQGAADTIAQWLSNNPQDVTATYWRSVLNYIQNILMTSRIMMPSKLVQPNPLWESGAWGMTKFFVDELGTRQGGVLKVSLANHARATELAKNLLHSNFSKFTNILTAGRKSHGMEVEQYYAEVINPVLASWANPEGGRGVNDTVNGHKITTQDMAVVKFMSRVTSEGFDIVRRGLSGRQDVTQPVYFQTEIGETGIKVDVRSTKITGNTTTRTYNRNNLAFLKAYLADGADKWAVLDAYLWSVVVPEISDRASVFHGDVSEFESALKVIADGIRINGLALADRNMDALVKRLSSVTQLDVPDLRTALLSYFDKMTTRVANMVLSDYQTIKVGDDITLRPTLDDVIGIDTIEQQTSMTRARKEALAGYWLYDYGFKESSSLINFSMSITAYFYERASYDFQRVATDLDRQRTELKTKISELVKTGQTPRKALATVVNRNRKDVQLGHTFDDYTSLTRKIKTARQYAELFGSVYSKSGSNADFDFTAINRAFGAATGSVLINELTSLRNIGHGWYALGQFANKWQGSIIGGYVNAAKQTWFYSMPKFVGSLGVSLAKASTVGVVKGGANFFTEVSKGNLRKAVVRGLDPMLTELTHNVFERVELMKEMLDGGYAVRNYTMDDFEAKTGALTTGGSVIQNDETGWMGKLGVGLMTAYDAAVLTTVGRPLLPKYTDNWLNHATMNVAFDTFGTWRNQLVKVWKFRKEHGIPMNTPLSPEELFGRLWLGKRTMNDLTFVRQALEWAPISIDDAAQRLFTNLETNKEAQLFTPAEAFAAADVLVQDTNKGTTLNRSLYLQRREWVWRVIAPLMGWPTQRLRAVIKLFSRASQDKNFNRFAMWSSIGMLVIVPALMAGAVADVGTEELARLLYRTLRGEERATRQPWERDGLKSQAIGWTIAAVNPIPFVQTIVNSMVNDMPNRASADPTLFIVSKFKDVLNYAGGVINTGDVSYGLPRVIKGFLPLSSIYLNQMDSTKGSVEALNARRLLTRYGPQELLQDRSFTSGTATQLTPYGERMLNAAIAEDYSGFMDIRREAIDVATKMGKAEPEKAVDQMMASRNPYSRAFKTKLTEQQRQTMLAKMSPAERQMLSHVEQKYERASSMIGQSANYTKEDSANSRGGGSGGSLYGAIPRGTLKSKSSRYRKTSRSKASRYKKKAPSRSRARKTIAPIKLKKGASRYRSAVKLRRPSLSRFARA